MSDSALYSIGTLARRTGLPVRTIRFYSDCGLLPPTGRSSAGHRLYDVAAVHRLDLVRTLRDLGMDLTTIQRVLEGEISMPQAAAAHTEALDAQIRILRLRRAILRVVANRGSSPEEMELMHKLAKLSDAERHRIIHDFIDGTFGGVDANPELLELLRSMMPNLPDDPTADQVDAWVELADLVREPDFKASVRRAAEHQAAERADGDRTGLHHELTNEVRDRVEAACADGVDPASEEAVPIVDQLVAAYSRTFGKQDTSDYRAKILARLEVSNDPRIERYFSLLAIINGWPSAPRLAAVFEWFIRALREHPDPSGWHPGSVVAPSAGEPGTL